MAKDYPVPLCGDCKFRPIDRDTRRPVEGIVRLGRRLVDGGIVAAVIYSAEDPRSNAQFRMTGQGDDTTVINRAQSCAPVVQGLPTHLTKDDFESRIRDERSKQGEAACRIGELLVVDAALPPNILFEQGQSS